MVKRAGAGQELNDDLVAPWGASLGIHQTDGAGLRRTQGCKKTLYRLSGSSFFNLIAQVLCAQVNLTSPGVEPGACENPEQGNSTVTQKIRHVPDLNQGPFALIGIP